VSADEVVLTAGSGEANGLVIQALVNPGEAVIVEQYVYGGTLNQLRRFEADVVGTPIDDKGIIPEAMDELMGKLEREGRKPKLIYTIPEHQNPTGSTLPEDRKRKILEIAHRRGVPILEDECYVDLRFEGERQPAFRTMDDSGIVIHVASFSKLIAPGLRMGFFTGTEEVRRRALSMKQGSGPNQFAAYAIDGFLRSDMDSHRDSANPLLKKKRDAMAKGLSEFFGSSGAKWSKPEGGCYSWLTMPEGTDISAVRDKVFEGGVGYLAGTSFAPNGDGQNCARLCFAFESPEKNYEGIKVLSQLFKQSGVM
jgi:2-aminoadipate transaminase